MYKIGNKDYMTTGKTFDTGYWKMLNAWNAYINGSNTEKASAANKLAATKYSTNSDAVLEAAQKIVDGEISKTTKGMTKSVREMLEHFRVR